MNGLEAATLSMLLINRKEKEEMVNNLYK